MSKVIVLLLTQIISIVLGGTANSGGCIPLISICFVISIILRFANDGLQEILKAQEGLKKLCLKPDKKANNRNFRSRR